MATSLESNRQINLPIISGDNPPSLITSFSSAGLSPLLQENLKKSGYKEPSPVQKACLPSIMTGRDLIVSHFSASGKTAAFLIPILHKLIEAGGCGPVWPRCVVITPSMDRATKIKTECDKLNSRIRFRILVHDLLVHDHRQMMRGCDILVCTLERMVEILDSGILKYLKYLVLDEADRIMGEQEFKQCMRDSTISGKLPPKEERQILLFSSYMSAELQYSAQEFLNECYLFVTVDGPSRSFEKDPTVEEEENDLEDIKKSMRMNFIENIQNANSKLASKEKEFTSNVEYRRGEKKKVKEIQQSDMRNIDLKFELEIFELEERKKEQEQALEITEKDLAEVKQRKKNSKEEALKRQNDEMRILNAKLKKDEDYEMTTLSKLKGMVDQLTKHLNALDLKPINEDHSEKAKLEAAKSTLECPICMETMRPPVKIWMCSSTHIVCEPCKVILGGRVCPTCRVKRVTQRAYIAEQFARSVFNN